MGDAFRIVVATMVGAQRNGGRPTKGNMPEDYAKGRHTAQLRLRPGSLCASWAHSLCKNLVRLQALVAE